MKVVIKGLKGVTVFLGKLPADTLVIIHALNSTAFRILL